MNLKNQPKHTSLLFVGVVILGIFVTLICSALILMPYIDAMASGSFQMLTLPREKLISVQVINMLGLFIIPPVMFALFSKNDFLEIFNLKTAYNSKKYLVAFLLAMVLFPVLINFQYWVTQLPLPENLKAMAEIQKATNEKILGIFLDFPGIPNLLLMIIVIGIGAGLTEELFFRGLLMSLIKKWTNSTWAAIILSGIIFSSFHANLYDFLPITIVGILFGYIYSKTNDLKLNIFIHAIYNSLQVVINYLNQNKIISVDIDKVDSVPIFVWIACVSLAIFFTFHIIKKNEYIPSTS